jgi:hypothetical protein
MARAAVRAREAAASSLSENETGAKQEMNLARFFGARCTIRSVAGLAGREAALIDGFSCFSQKGMPLTQKKARQRVKDRKIRFQESKSSSSLTNADDLEVFD